MTLPPTRRQVRARAGGGTPGAVARVARDVTVPPVPAAPAVRAASASASDPADPARAEAAPGALSAADLGRPLGRDVTFLQLSSGFCAPCRATRRVLERVVDTGDGVAHVEVDVADRPDLAERFAVTQTPTVVVLDAAGAPVARVTGVPTLAAARATVATLTARP